MGWGGKRHPWVLQWKCSFEATTKPPNGLECRERERVEGGEEEWSRIDFARISTLFHFFILFCDPHVHFDSGRKVTACISQVVMLSLACFGMCKSNISFLFFGESHLFRNCVKLQLRLRVK